ncbi:MAG: transposase [Isosphaeraceae bacterium]
MLFTKDEDFLAFERVVEETLRTRRMRLCAYPLMPNHWHFVVWPERDGDLPAFMQQVTNTHVKRWKEHHHEIGYGHLYQGRYKCFPVETEDYFYQVVRYVERNALRANLLERAESWRRSSLRRVEREDTAFPILSAWPLPRPTDWLQLVNQPQTEAEVSGGAAVLRQSRSALRRSQLGHRHGLSPSGRGGEAPRIHIPCTMRPPRIHIPCTMRATPCGRSSIGAIPQILIRSMSSRSIRSLVRS